MTISFQLNFFLLVPLDEMKSTLTIICIELQSSLISKIVSIHIFICVAISIHIHTYKHILFTSNRSVIYVIVTGERVIFEIGIIVCSIA